MGGGMGGGIGGMQAQATHGGAFTGQAGMQGIGSSANLVRGDPSTFDQQAVSDSALSKVAGSVTKGLSSIKQAVSTKIGNTGFSGGMAQPFSGHKRF